MSANMVERVAREMFERRTKNRAGVKWAETHSHTRKTWLQAATIAIEAMRELPAALHGVGDNEIGNDGLGFGNAWVAVIDAALQEPKT